MNDHPQYPQQPDPAADPSAAVPPATPARPPADADATVVQPVAQPAATDWPPAPGSGWNPEQPAAPTYGTPAPQSAPPQPYGAPTPQSAPPQGAQSGAPYGAAPGGGFYGGASFGGQPEYGAQQGGSYGAQAGPAYGPPPGEAYPGYPNPAASGYPPPGSGGTSGFAIASLIFGILGGILLSVIFGIVALVQIRKRGQTGRGMAIAGLVLSGCWLLLIGIGITAAIISDKNDSTTGSSPTGSISVTQLKPGDCINGIQAASNIEDLPVVSCALPHEGEVYAVFDLPSGPWPGDTAVQAQADKRCETELKLYAPKPADTVEVLYLHPLEESWSRDRGVTCVATDKNGTSTGSVRD